MKFKNVKRRGFFKHMIKFLLVFFFSVGIAIGLTIFGVYVKYSKDISFIPPQKDYKPALTTKFYADNLDQIASYSTEAREVIPYEKIPKLLIKAFISSEDIEFFDHDGLNYVGILRAMIKNVKAGRIVQGGSSISQQTAKSFLSDKEQAARSYTRKIKEVIMARRAEQLYDKEYLLYLYLNQIYLGHASYGVQAASKHYFNKNVWDLNLAEITLIAGLPQAPSKYSPYKKIESAKERRKYVLSRMLKNGFITKEDMDKALSKKIMIIKDIPGRANYYVSLKELYPNTIFIYDYGVRIDTLSKAKNILYEDTYTKAPYFSEYIHKVVQKMVGQKEFYQGGYKVYTTVSPEKQYLARDAVKKGLGNLSWRQGYYGPVINDEIVRVLSEETVYKSNVIKNDTGTVFKKGEVLSHKEIPRAEVDEKLLKVVKNKRYIEKTKQRRCYTRKTEIENFRIKKKEVTFYTRTYEVIYNHCLKDDEFNKFTENSKKYYLEDKPVKFKRYMALVTDVSRKEATVKYGNFTGKMLLKNTAWAGPANPLVHTSRRRISDMRHVVSKGYVIWIRVSDDDKSYKKNIIFLSQIPKSESSLISVDYSTGYVKALIGGRTYSDFNRALQAERQSGSIFKPIYYSKAIDEDYTLSTILYDTPIVSYDYLTKVNWKPANYNNSYEGKVTLRTALKNSMNIPSIKVFQHVGIEKALKWAKRLGITSKLNHDDSAALGSSAIKLVDITHAFSIFANYGKSVKFTYIKKIVNRDGKIVVDNTKYYDPFIDVTRVDAQLEKALFTEQKRIIDPVTAFLAIRLLRAVAKEGTAVAVNSLKIPVAGKTGTTNDSFDAWFMGFTTSLVTGVWVGNDLNDAPLGVGEAGGKTALPIWKEYTKNALAINIKNKKEREFVAPKNVRWVTIDKKSGKKASADSISRIREAFRVGTEPKETESSENNVSDEDMMLKDF